VVLVLTTVVPALAGSGQKKNSLEQRQVGIGMPETFKFRSAKTKVSVTAVTQ